MGHQKSRRIETHGEGRMSENTEPRADHGLGSFAAAIPSPKAGCMMKNGATMVPMPMINAGGSVG